jgi:acyl carrier protein
LVQAVEKRTPLPADIEIDPFNYVETGHVDSIEMIRFVLEIESEFGIEITAGDMELAGFKTIGGLASMINAKLEHARSANA